MRIGFIISQPFSGGMGTVIESMIRFEEKEIFVDIISAIPVPNHISKWFTCYAPENKQKGIRTDFGSPIINWHTLAEFRSLEKSLNQAFLMASYDLLYCNDVPTAWMLKLMGCKVPTYVQLHQEEIVDPDFLDNPFGMTEDLDWIRLMRQSIETMKIKTLVLSEGGLEYVQNGLAKQISMIPPKVFRMPLRQDYIVSQHLNFEETEGVLWVGAKATRKNFEEFLEIAERLPHIPFTAHFGRIFGKATSKREIPNNVTVSRKKVSQRELIELYQNHRFGIVTSIGETFSFVAQEHGLFHPTFFKAVSPMKEIWTKVLKLGYHNIDQAINEITIRYENEDQWYKMMKFQRYFMEGHYSIEVSQSDLENLSLITRGTKAGFEGSIRKQVENPDTKLEIGVSLQNKMARWKSKIDCIHGSSFVFNDCEECKKDKEMFW